MDLPEPEGHPGESSLLPLSGGQQLVACCGADPKRAAAGPILRGPPGQVLPAVLDRDRAVPAEPSAQRRALYGSLDFRAPQARRTERMTPSGQARQTIGHLIEEVPYEK